MPVLESFMQAQTPTQSVDPGGIRTLAGGASANDFGGQVGRAVEGAGDALGAYAQMQRQDQKTLDNFKRQTAWQDFLSGEQTRMAESERAGLADGGAGFTKGYLTGQAAGGPAAMPAPGAPAAAAAQQPSAATDGGFDGRAQKWLDANSAGATPQERAQWQEQVASARRTMGAQALQKEFQERDRFYKSQISDKLDGMMKGIDQTPAGLDSYIKQGSAVIDASGLSAADKQAQKDAWESNAKLVYGYANARNDPAGTAAKLGSTSVGYFAKIKGRESGGDVNATDARTGATGGYGFLPSTWRGVVNSPEGKAAGLTEAGIHDFAQTDKGVRILTAQNAHVLQQNGLDPSEANLRMAHFLGPQGAVDFMAQMKANPGAAAAATFTKEAHYNHDIFFSKDGVPQTLGQVYAHMTSGFTGASVPTTTDPHLDDLSYVDKFKVLGAAERNFNQNNAEAAAAQQQAHQQFTNDLYTRLHDGKAGLPDIIVARQSGQLTNIGEIERAENIVASREGDVSALQRFGAMTAANAAFNPFDKDHKDAVEAGFKAAGGDVPAALKTWQQTGVMPQGGAVALRGALTSTDAGKVQSAANAIGNMLGQSPNALAGVTGQSELEDAGARFNHYVHDLGKTPEEAAQKIMQANDPAFKAKMRVGEPEVKAFRDDIAKGDPAADVLKSFGGFMGFGSPAAEPGQRGAVATDYAEIAAEHFQANGDKDAAKAYASAQIHKLYGVSNGVLMKFPPEHVYPAMPGGDFSYLYKQAAADIHTATGETVDPSKVFLTPLPNGLTAQAWRAGQPTPYALHYTGEVDGQPVVKVILSPGKATHAPWVADTSEVSIAHSVAAAQAHADTIDSAKGITLPMGGVLPITIGGPNPGSTKPGPLARDVSTIRAWLASRPKGNVPNIRK